MKIMMLAKIVVAALFGAAAITMLVTPARSSQVVPAELIAGAIAAHGG